VGTTILSTFDNGVLNDAFIVGQRGEGGEEAAGVRVFKAVLAKPFRLASQSRIAIGISFLIPVYYQKWPSESSR
jgi:hypothetical protein